MKVSQSEFMKENNSEPQYSRRDRLMALLSLSSHTRMSHTKIPSKKVLEDFYAGRLSSAESEKVFEYFELHPEAYQEWLLSSPAKTKSASVELLKHHLTSLMEYFSSNLIFRYAAVSSIMVAALAIVLLLGPWTSDSMGKKIDQGYVQLRLDQKTQLIGKSLTFPWQDSDGRYAFAEDKAVTSMEQAFALGLIQGKKTLLLTEDSIAIPMVEDHLLSYRELGRWNVMLWAATQKNQTLPSTFWRTQIEVTQEFSEILTIKDAIPRLVQEHLIRVEQFLQKIQENPQKRRSYIKLEEELALMRMHFAPSQLPGQP